MRCGIVMLEDPRCCANSQDVSISCQRTYQHWLDVAFDLAHFLTLWLRWVLSLGQLFCFCVVPISQLSSPVNLRKSGSFLTSALGAYCRHPRCYFWSPPNNLGMNLAVILLVFNSSHKICWQVPYVKPMISQTWIVHLWSSRVASTVLLFSNVVPVDGWMPSMVIILSWS